MSKVLRSCDYLMPTTIGFHSLHNDRKVLLAQPWLDKYLPKFSSLLIKWRKRIYLDSTVSLGSIHNSSHSFVNMLILDSFTSLVTS